MARTESIERRSARSTQLVTSISLSALFLLVYGWTNWLTAQRGNVPTLSFEWERFIPFVPLMIVPYMSIDLFFVAAPFFCRNDRELAAFSKRIATAILIAGVCFLLFPFRFAFERPPAGGWLGAFFDWFRGLDQPHNLLPSLHITFCTILANHYAGHTRGLVRGASNVWFALIALSAVLTYQHHVLDVVAGFALGVYCLHFFPEETVRIPANTNPRIAVYYVVGTLSVLALAILFWPWGAFLLWPAISFAIVALGYLGAGPGIFRKRHGRLPWPTSCALGPVLLGHELSRCHYRRKCEAWNELTPRVWIGGVLNQREAAAAVRNGVTAVLDLTAEFSEALPFLGVTYRNIPVLDLTAPTAAQLEEMAAFIEEHAAGIVYVHCKIGYSRTVTAAAAYLLRSGIAPSVEEALDMVRGARPAVVIRPEVQAALDEFEKALGTSASTSQ